MRVTVAQYLFLFHGLGCISFGVSPECFDGEGKELGGREGPVEHFPPEGVIAVHYLLRDRKVAYGKKRGDNVNTKFLTSRKNGNIVRRN